MIFGSSCHRIRLLLGSVFLLGAFAAVPAQSGNVDLGFNASPFSASAIEGDIEQVIQPDGKIIVFNSTVGIFRLNSDGTTDTTFSYCNCGGVGVRNIMVGADGKIVLAGTAAPNHAKMIRLNADGSLDSSFSVFIQAVGPPEFTGNFLTVNAIQPDGKVIATHTSWGNIQGTWFSYSMRRYNTDASIDSSFTSPALEGGHLVSTSALIEPLPDGRFYLAISSGSHLGYSLKIHRRLANGSLDPTFTEFTRSLGGGYFLTIRDLSLTDDGGLLAAGTFWPSMTGGPYNQNIFRFTSTGALYPGFSPSPVYYGTGVHFLPDGKILFSAALTSFSTPIMMRLTGTGALDNTYVMDPAVTSIVNMWRADLMHRPTFLAQTSQGRRLVRLLDNGGLDPGFSPQVLIPSSVGTIETQSDGKVLLAGPFSVMNGVARGRIARVNADGSLDMTFDPGSGFTGEWPSQLLMQPDGKILAVGTFSAYNGALVPGLVRLNSNGSIDKTFTVNLSGTAYAVALQPDGKILVGGNFTAVNGVNRTGLARLNTNGSLDASFDVVLTGPTLRKIIVEPNGKITIGGSFTGVNGVTRMNLARLESTGALDQSLNASVGVLSSFWQQPDGKYLITAGPASSFARLNNNGGPDPSFTPPAFGPSGSSYVWSVLFRSDGTMLVGGRFDTVGGLQRPNLTRLRWNGMHDTTFIPNGANGDVSTIIPYAGGKVMVGGAFRTVDNVSRTGVARLNPIVFQRTTPFDFDGDGKTDIAAFRPATNIWYILHTSDWTVLQTNFGSAGDIVAPADFDGDGKTDPGIFRPSTGDWWYAASTTGGGHRMAHHGVNGDIPRPSDFDGDGKADMIVYRPSTGRWFRLASNGAVSEVQFGAPGDQPVVGDFDGDGRSDPAVFRPSSGDWWYAASGSGNQHTVVHWGQTGDLPSPGDFDGDGKTDFAVFRPSEGGWYVYRSATGTFMTLSFGLNGDRPIPGDYDGDGSVDIAVFRPSNGLWYLLQSTSGFGALQWGLAQDVVIPNAFVPQP